MTDTLQTIVKTIQMTSTDSFDLINKVDSFYSSSWDKLIIMLSISFGIIGIVIPLIIQWYQKKTLNISQKLLRKDIETEVLKTKSEIQENINKILEEKLTVFESKFKELNASNYARTLHLQGNDQFNKQLYLECLQDFIISAFNYMICNDHSNLNAVLDNINASIQHLSKEEIDNLKIINECDLEKLLQDLSKYDEKGAFILYIRKIRENLVKAPKTIKEKKP